MREMEKYAYAFPKLVCKQLNVHSCFFRQPIVFKFKIAHVPCSKSSAIYIPTLRYNYSLITKPTRCTNFSNVFFGIELCMFRTGFLSIISSLVLYNSNRYIRYMSYSLCWRDQDGTDPASKQSAYPVWHIPIAVIQYWTTDDGQKTSPKHVEFHSKNTFEKLVHLIGFVIRIS